ncbi:MAG TPA: hypothetical protein PK335_12660 [Draconibacterium sp.]|nr:hypothetical protein [Draconibacterium sp.]
MKKYISGTIAIFIIITAFIGCNKTETEDLITSEADNYRITAQKYSTTINLEDAVSTEFGQDYRIADWNDLTQLTNPSQSILDMEITKYDLTLLLTNNGSHFYSDTRHYFMSYHNHQLPTTYSYLSHNNIDNHLIDLGSWETTAQILCVKK